MADLLDIAPSTACAVVTFGDKQILVRGLSANAIASIVARFPDLGLLLGGMDGNIGPRLIERFGAAVGPIIAAGCGHVGEEKYEQHASNLLIEDQLRLLKPIIGLTFPNGLLPFVQALTAIMPNASEGEEKKTIKVRLKTPPSPSPPSSDADSRQIMQ